MRPVELLLMFSSTSIKINIHTVLIDNRTKYHVASFIHRHGVLVRIWYKVLYQLAVNLVQFSLIAVAYVSRKHPDPVGFTFFFY